MRRIDPNEPPEIGSLLIHGLNNVGKTHILASLLAHEKQYGQVMYVNMRGEPHATIFAHDMAGVELVELEKLEEVSDLAKSIDHVHAIALDSIQRLGELAGVKVTGGSYIIGAKEDHGKDWNKLKGETFRAIAALQQRCELFVAVCPSNLHEHAITHELRVVPDVPGIGEKLVGRFNFVGYLTARTITESVTTRLLDFQPRLDAVTRWNAKGPVPKPLTVKQGLGGWLPIKLLLEKGLDGE
jgi:hypothetical protein